MFVKPFAACGAVLLPATVAFALCFSEPALSANEGDAVPPNPALADPAPGSDIRTLEANPSRYQEATAGTPDQSLWRSPPSKASASREVEPQRAARDKPMMLLNGLFEPSRTSPFPHP